MEENKDYNPSQYEDDDRMEAPKSAKSIRGYQTIIVILAVILAALSILYFNIHRQQQEEYDLLLVDRDSIKSNLSHLMEDFDNLQISNDSISQSLGLERSRADSLMERLTKERSWSYAKIKKYEKEIGDANNKLDINGILKTIKSAPASSAFLFHACAHNPTGVDPTKQQWKQISDAIKAAGCGVIFDCAYQGFASGDMEGDAYAIRLFVEEGHQVCLAQSFAKNFGLYGERCGAASVVCASKEEKERVVSQLKVAARTLWSNPPLYGARIVQTVLGDPKLKAQWYEECAGMAKRIISMRAALVENLKKAGSTRDWSHITSQIGMFAYTGLTKPQVERCIKEFHIYLTMNGRISIAGLNTHNVEYVAKAFHEVTKN